MRILTRLALGEPHKPRVSEPGPLATRAAVRQIHAVLERQRADAAAKDAEAWKWGNAGALVRRAIRDCEAILLPLPEEKGLRPYLEAALPKIATLADRYRNDADDPDGHGLGTVREIEESLKVIARVCGIEV